jgi:hypothetical protein
MLCSSRVVSKEQKVWIAQLMTPWLDRVVLQDDEATARRSNLIHFTSNELLENLYLHITVPLIQKHENLETLNALWLHIAQAYCTFLL